jgi:N-acetylglucosamine-6-phosphate deacetylase
MLRVTGATLVLPDRVIERGTLVIETGRIAVVDERPPKKSAPGRQLDLPGRVVVPGFIDLHVHGVDGHDVLDGGAAVTSIAARMPHFGVTAFCPTTVACTPDALRAVLSQVRQCRATPPPGARVLGAHLESNFINPAMCGAQPVEHLRLPPGADAGPETGFSAADILDVVAAHRKDVAIVTVAPELPGGLELVSQLTEAGHRVSLGHSSADFATAHAAFDAGARHATHLFNRMPPMSHRAPGLVGAVLSRDDVTAELICDGYHVHPAVMRLAIAAKTPGGIVAISDGTAGSGLPVGSCARLGGRSITVGERAAFLDDGTLAGSTLTMDGAFRQLLTLSRDGLVDAATMCCTSPARALGLDSHGIIAPGAAADFVVLDQEMTVEYTCIAGGIVYARDSGERQ